MRQVPGPIRDPRADELLQRYRAAFGGDDLPVPIEAIAEDLLGLAVEGRDLEGASGLLYPAERQVYLNAADSPARRRFTLAHEVGHWVCQVQEGRTASVYCRADEVGVGEGKGKALEREANVFAAELLMPQEAVRSTHEGAVSETAVRFGVSPEAMGWRLYNVGLLEVKPGA
jgi:Zn-dependent peptidase ImmA (M78 family)